MTLRQKLIDRLTGKTVPPDDPARSVEPAPPAPGAPGWVEDYFMRRIERALPR